MHERSSPLTEAEFQSDRYRCGKCRATLPTWTWRGDDWGWVTFDLRGWHQEGEVWKPGDGYRRRRAAAKTITSRPGVAPVDFMTGTVAGFRRLALPCFLACPRCRTVNAVRAPAS